MTGRKLIVLNTLVSYGRSLLSVGITLFSTRWILKALGEGDLGLYYAIGGVTVFLSFINTAMTFSAQRHFSYAMGHGGPAEVKDWFNSSLSLHLLFASLFLILSAPLGVVAFKWLLTIPSDRLTASAAVYVCSVLAAAGSIVSVPFNAIYVARQHIYELTVIQLMQTIALFALAWGMLNYDGDRLIAYAIGMLAINLMIYGIQVVRCYAAFPECSLDTRRMVDWGRYGAILSFSGLGLISTFAYILRGQGIALLLNNFGGPGANAAYGIANNVSGQVGFLSGGLMNAISPEITKLEGAGKHIEMMSVSTRACKFATLLVLLIFVPMMTDADPLLTLWLEEVPVHTMSFVRVMMVAFLAVQMVLGVTAATKAYGKIVMPELCASISLLIAVPLSYFLIRFGLTVVYVVAVIALTAILCSISTLVCARLIFSYPIMEWVKQVFFRNCFAAVIVFGFNFYVHSLMAASLQRFVLVGLIDGILLMILGWVVILNKEERLIIREWLAKRSGT